MKPVPEFAILGHPNEGKSSVVSTLAEDDSVRIGPVPGETIVCQTFPVVIDGEEVIRFTDTPGFQQPRLTLSWMRSYQGPDRQRLAAFVEAKKNDSIFRDEVELFKPLLRGAGIIYVVDGSRPLRNSDRAEMEILRMTALPRMAIINCKKETTQYLDQWKDEFRRHFNSIRMFNAVQATYQERIDLLEALKHVDQDWEEALRTVIEAFKSDWFRRIIRCAEIILELIESVLRFSLTERIKDSQNEEKARLALENRFRDQIAKMEKSAEQAVRGLFRHNIFDSGPPAESLLNEQIFSRRTWQFLGLKPGQLAMAAGVAGLGAGAVVDTAAAGLTFGIFTAIGGAVGAGSVLLGRKKLSSARIKGVRLGQDTLKVGPLHDIQLMHVLLDRSFLHFASIINWAHGRRDYENFQQGLEAGSSKTGQSAEWSQEDRQTAALYFKMICKKSWNRSRDRDRRKAMMHLTVKTLQSISQMKE